MSTLLSTIAFMVVWSPTRVPTPLAKRLTPCPLRPVSFASPKHPMRRRGPGGVLAHPVPPLSCLRRPPALEFHRGDPDARSPSPADPLCRLPHMRATSWPFLLNANQ